MPEKVCCLGAVLSIMGKSDVMEEGSVTVAVGTREDSLLWCFGRDSSSG